MGLDVDVELEKADNKNQDTYHLTITGKFSKTYPDVKLLDSITTNKTTRLRIMNNGMTPLILHPKQTVAVAVTIPETACVSTQTLEEIDNYYEAVANGTQLSRQQRNEAERLSNYAEYLMPLLKQNKNNNETTPNTIEVNTISQEEAEDSYTSFDYHPSQEELDEIEQQLEEDYKNKQTNRLEGVDINIGHPNIRGKTGIQIISGEISSCIFKGQLRNWNCKRCNPSHQTETRSTYHNFKSIQNTSKINQHDATRIKRMDQQRTS